MVLDLWQRTKKRSIENHKQFCSTYVQLSRLQSLEGILFLKLIWLEDINNQPHYKLQSENNWLQILGKQTLSLFKSMAKQRRQYQEW